MNKALQFWPRGGGGGGKERKKTSIVDGEKALLSH